ncbi:MAG: hypothetical protein L3J46_01200 [Kangiellaceae bacterium]|nr:hypothetical protein [Kangiellaceae bacterium]
MNIEFKGQLKRNALALISLSIAISALAYNSWRNELSEQNRNVRAAGFEIIKETAKLQSFLDHSTYGNSIDEQKKTPIEGWVRINLIRSLSIFMNERVKGRAAELLESWQKNWRSIRRDSSANQKITETINALAVEVNAELVMLN